MDLSWTALRPRCRLCFGSHLTPIRPRISQHKQRRCWLSCMQGVHITIPHFLSLRSEWIIEAQKRNRAWVAVDAVCTQSSEALPHYFINESISATSRCVETCANEGNKQINSLHLRTAGKAIELLEIFSENQSREVDKDSRCVGRSIHQESLHFVSASGSTERSTHAPLTPSRSIKSRSTGDGSVVKRNFLSYSPRLKT